MLSGVPERSSGATAGGAMQVEQNMYSLYVNYVLKKNQMLKKINSVLCFLQLDCVQYLVLGPHSGQKRRLRSC